VQDQERRSDLFKMLNILGLDFTRSLAYVGKKEKRDCHTRQPSRTPTISCTCDGYDLTQARKKKACEMLFILHFSFRLSDVESRTKLRFWI